MRSLPHPGVSGSMNSNIVAAVAQGGKIAVIRAEKKKKEQASKGSENQSTRPETGDWGKKHALESPRANANSGSFSIS